MHIPFFRRCGACFLALGVLLCAAACFWMPVKAAGNGTHTLTLICSEEQVILSDMHWSIYAVGKRNTYSPGYALTGVFANYPVTLDDTTVSAMQEAAATLENYAVLDEIVPQQQGVTDAEGKLCFDALEPGLYLISGETKTVGEVRYVPTAAFIEIVERDETIDLVSYPKFKVRKVLVSSSSRYSVSKVWMHDEEYLADRPASLTIELYRDNELADTVILNEANKWSYTWTAEDNAEWRVKELDVPKRYSVIYTANETQFVIVNSRSSVQASTVVPKKTTAPEENSTTIPAVTATKEKTTTATVVSGGNSLTTGTEQTTATVYTAVVQPPASGGGFGNGSSGGKLPQTGQLWWPVPVLAASGLISIMVGWKLRVKK